MQAAVRSARVNFVLKDTDWTYLESVLPDMTTVRRIPPFLDVEAQPQPCADKADVGFPNSAPLLFAAGMMRPGHKFESYRQLADALCRIADADWNLVVAGEGPERSAVEAILDFLVPDRVRFLDSVEHEAMSALMDRSNLLVWPGIGEATGMVFLEA